MRGDAVDGEAHVIQGVQLLHVELNGAEVTADLIGGHDPVIMAEIVFRTDDVMEQQRLVQTFGSWEARSTPLALVHSQDGFVTLSDEDGVFASALG